MHQPAQRRFVPIFTIHIHDMRVIPECFICFQHTSFHPIQWEPFFWGRPVPWWKSHTFPAVPRNSHLTAEGSRPRCCCGNVRACCRCLYPPAVSQYLSAWRCIKRKDIQPYRASLQVLDAVLVPIWLSSLSCPLWCAGWAPCILCSPPCTCWKIVIHESQLPNLVQIIPAPAFCYSYCIQISPPLSPSLASYLDYMIP